MAGELNGTLVLVAIEDTPGSGTYTPVGGQTSHTLTLNNAVIDITNKDSNSFRVLLANAGLKSCDLSLELMYNSDSAYLAVRALYENQGITNFRVSIGGTDFDCAYMVASFADTSPDNSAVSSTISLQSSGSFTWV